MKKSFSQEAVGVEDKIESQWSHCIGVQDRWVSGRVLYASELNLRDRNISLIFLWLPKTNRTMEIAKELAQQNMWTKTKDKMDFGIFTLWAYDLITI